MNSQSDRIDRDGSKLSRKNLKLSFSETLDPAKVAKPKRVKSADSAKAASPKTVKSAAAAKVGGDRDSARVRRVEGGGRNRVGVKTAGPPSGRALADLVAAAAKEHKVVSPVLLDLTGLSSVADWYYIASAQNARQLGAVAEKIARRTREAGVRSLGREGVDRDDSRWTLLDLGDVVVHLFTAEARALYDLESLWADAPRVEAPI
jgi:ribosome-associated protein